MRLIHEDGLDLTVEQIGSGQILSDILDRLGVPTTRENLQNLFIDLERRFGKEFMSSAMHRAIHNSMADIAIVDSIRMPSDYKMLRNLDDLLCPNVLIYITADLVKRYNYTKTRKEKAGESMAPIEQFIEEELAKTEIHIPEIGKKADPGYKIENNGTVTEYLEEIADRYRRLIKPLQR